MFPTWSASGTTKETSPTPSMHSLPCILSLFFLPLPLPLCPNRGLFNVTDSAGECGVPYERRFAMPRPAPDQPWSVCVTIYSILSERSAVLSVLWIQPSELLWAPDLGTAHESY